MIRESRPNGEEKISGGRVEEREGKIEGSSGGQIETTQGDEDVEIEKNQI